MDLSRAFAFAASYETTSKTIESIKNLIDLYEAWNKPDKAVEWRAKLPKTEAVQE
jgi:hypothetical protein